MRGCSWASRWNCYLPLAGAGPRNVVYACADPMIGDGRWDVVASEQEARARMKMAWGVVTWDLPLREPLLSLFLEGAPWDVMFVLCPWEKALWYLLGRWGKWISDCYPDFKALLLVCCQMIFQALPVWCQHYFNILCDLWLTYYFPLQSPQNSHTNSHIFAHPVLYLFMGSLQAHGWSKTLSCVHYQIPWNEEIIFS